MIALIQVDDDHARIFLEKFLRFGGGAVALRAETQLVARAIPDERRNRTVLRREERQSRAIKSHQAPSSAIKRRTGRQTSARNQEQSRAIKRHQAPTSAVPDAKPVLAIKSNQEQSSAIKRQQAPYRTPNQCSTMTSVSRFSYTRISACQIRQHTIVGPGNQRSAVKVTCPN